MIIKEEILYKISKFLPFRCGSSEANYIKYLSNSFDKLSNKVDDSDISDGFAIIPFHLLFMMALNYRVLRISKDQSEKYHLALTFKKEIKENEKIFNPSSPFDFSVFGESEVLNFFKLVGCKEDELGKIKSLIRVRNNLAHANGNIEINPEKRCEEYLGSLEIIQKLFSKSNQQLAHKFLKEIESDENIEQFFEIRYKDNIINEYDLKEIAGIFIKKNNITKDQKKWLKSVIQ